MKHLTYLIAVLVGVMFISSCDKDKIPTDTKPEGNEFLFLYTPGVNADHGPDKGFFKVTIDKDGESEIARLNDFYPTKWQNVDANNGHVAFVAHDNINIDDAARHSRLAYFNASSPGNISVVNPPEEAPIDWHWEIWNNKSTVMKDGRIIANLYLVHRGGLESQAPFYYIGVYDPMSKSWTISQEISDFVLAQPEKGHDTEGGILDADKVLSPDEKRVYFRSRGYGLQGGVYHYDYGFITYYDIDKNEFGRVMEGDFIPVGVSKNSVFYRDGGKLHAVDLSGNNKTEITDRNGLLTGAGSKDEFIFVWRGAGMATYRKSGGSYEMKHIINVNNLTDRKYRGLDARAYYVDAEEAIVFSATTDLHTNYPADFVVYKTPLKEENPDPEFLFELSKEFNANFWMLK